jgi:hypothetical protein
LSGFTARAGRLPDGKRLISWRARWWLEIECALRND